MSNIVKIIIVVFVLITIIATTIVFLVPGIRQATTRSIALQDQKIAYNDLLADEERIKVLIDNSKVLEAKNEVLSMKLPYEHDISILTNELYEIAQISGVTINNIDHTKIDADTKEDEASPINIFETNLSIQGSYYDTLSFVYTLEIMPRVATLEKVTIEADSEDYELLSVYITFNSYYFKKKS